MAEVKTIKDTASEYTVSVEVTTSEYEKQFDDEISKIARTVKLDGFRQGKVPHSRSKNKALEKFRVASNLAYDLFNNGLGNRRSHFQGFFGWAPYTRGGMTNSQFEEAERKLEPVITRIIIDAAKEQGIS